MRLMMTALAFGLLALIGVAPASAGGLQSPATVKAVDNGHDGGVVQDVRHRRHGYRYGYGYALPYGYYGYGGYGGYYGGYSYRPRYYYAPYAYYYPAPQYYGYYAPGARYYYKRKFRHRDWDDDWDD